MAVKAITIENFKGINKPVRVELKPITLLFGPNSAGKSTIVQALHYIREILERGNVDADRIRGADDSFNLGGFKNFVHGHDLENTIRLSVDLDLTEVELPQYPIHTGHASKSVNGSVFYTGTGNVSESFDWDIQEHVDLKSARVSLEIDWSYLLERPLVTSYAVAFDDEPFARISCADDGKQVRISGLNFLHPSFPVDRFGVDPDDAIDFSIFEALFYGVASDELSEAQSRTQNTWADINMLLEAQATPIPVWGKHLHISNLSLAEWYQDEVSGSGRFELVQLLAYLSQLLIGPGELLLSELKTGRYIGPIRKVPERNFDIIRSQEESRWSSGLAAWDRLHLASPEFVEQASVWMSDEHKLNTGYGIKVRRFCELDMESPLYNDLVNDSVLDIEESVASLIKALPEKRELIITENRKLIRVSPQDIGIGISQVLPVVVGAIAPEIKVLMIEQPELHIHPGLQCRLGDLFISQIKEGKKIFILETHSEHLLLRLLRRIRETHEGELPKWCPTLAPSDVSIVYLEAGTEGVRAKQLEVSEDGDSQGEWPKGFFEERAGELF